MGGYTAAQLGLGPAGPAQEAGPAPLPLFIPLLHRRPGSSGGYSAADLGLSSPSGVSQSPQNGNGGQTEGTAASDRFAPPEDPNDNWLQKGWHFLDTPITQSLLGWGQYREGAGGFERGVEKILSGLTSPLSLITMAAFAPVGIGESVAGSVLKEGLIDEAAPLLEKALSPNEATTIVGEFGKAIKAAQSASLSGKPIDEAVEAAGMNPGKYTRMSQYLRDQGFKETDVLPEGAIRRVASQGMAMAGVPAGKALAIAKAAETMTTLGFGLSAVRGAAYAYPKMAQLMEEGRVNDAMEYLVEGTADTAFAALGGAGALHGFKDLGPSLNEKNNLPLTEGSQVVQNIASQRDAEFMQGVSFVSRGSSRTAEAKI